MKSPDFPYEIYKFLIEGIRASDDGALERYLGGPQEQFERDHQRILDLKWLSDPTACPDDQLDYLLALVGWDGTLGQQFIETISAQSKRKLIKLSAELWKTKGRSSNLIDAIRVFTGKSVQITDYFWSRCLIGGSAMQYTGLAGDAWITGLRMGSGTPTLDDYEIWLLINRQGLTSQDYRLIYELVSYIRPALEHIWIVYVSFLDNFESNALARWTETGTPGASSILDNKLTLGPGAALEPNVNTEELLTWKDSWKWDSSLIYSQRSPVPITRQGLTLTWRGVASGGLTGEYIIGVWMSDGGFTDELTVRLGHRLPGGGVTSDVTEMSVIPVTPPTGALNNYFGLQVAIQAVSAAEVEVIISIGGNELIRHTYVGVRAFWEASASCEIKRVGADPDVLIQMDNVQIAAPPVYFQPVGQQPVWNGIADPDPGLWPFIDPNDPSVDGGLLPYFKVPEIGDTTLYDSADAETEGLERWLNNSATTGVHKTDLFRPYQDKVLWWVNEETGFGTPAHPGPGLLSADVIFAQFFFPGWANPGGLWTENAAAPGQLVASGTGGPDIFWKLDGGVTGSPSAQPRYWEYDSTVNPIPLEGPGWVPIAIAQGPWEPAVAGGYELTQPLPGENLKVQVDFGLGAGWETVREFWPRGAWEGDVSGKAIANWIYIPTAGTFKLRFVQESYRSTDANWAIGYFGNSKPADPSQSTYTAHFPFGVYDYMSCGFQGNASGGHTRFPGGTPATNTEEFYNPFTATIDDRFDLSVDLWYHLPAQNPTKDDVEVTTKNEWIELWYQSDATGGVDTLANAVVSFGRANPYPAIDPPQYGALPGEYGHAPVIALAGVLPGDTRFNNPYGLAPGAQWWWAARIPIENGQWQGASGFSPSLKFVSGEAADGPYNTTDIGMGVARVRLVVERT